jgi:OHCU decarboxylase
VLTDAIDTTADLATINRLQQADFVRMLGGVFEHSPWVAERAHSRSPFADLDDLHEAMMRVVRDATRGEQIALIRAHPELAGREAGEGTLTASSTGEQGRLGFTSLARTEFLNVAEINRRYREKFGFPCIVALRLHASRDTVIAEMERRLDNSIDAEVARALDQIGHIARGRLERLVGAT